MDYVRDVCSVPSGGFVVAAENGLYEQKDKGESVGLLLNMLY